MDGWKGRKELWEEKEGKEWGTEKGEEWAMGKRKGKTTGLGLLLGLRLHYSYELGISDAR